MENLDNHYKSYRFEQSYQSERLMFIRFPRIYNFINQINEKILTGFLL